jgi:ribose transport system ATP-binding protein
MMGAIDLSVGPLTGFCVIIGSFFIAETSSPEMQLLGVLLIFVFAVVVGLSNWTLAEPAGLHPVIATLVMYMVLLALALLFRPVPGGAINSDAASLITTRIGFVPVAAIAVTIVAVLLELALRRTAWGAAVRATGSDPDAAAVRGIRLRLVRVTAYVACSVLAAVGGVLLVAQVGSGLAGAGTGYTLSSIAAVVLGGTSILGGRGSFIGTLAGAFLLQEIINVTVFLGLSAAWHEYLLGAVLLVAVAGYAKISSSFEVER